MSYTFSGLLGGFGAQPREVLSPHGYQDFMGQHVYVHGNSSRGSVSVHSVKDASTWTPRRETPTLFNATEVLLADAVAGISQEKYRYLVKNSKYQQDDRKCASPADCLPPGKPMPAVNPPVCTPRRKCSTYRRFKQPFAYFMGRLVHLSEAPGIQQGGEQIRLLEDPAGGSAKFISVVTGAELVSARYLYFGPQQSRKMFNVRAVGGVFGGR